MKKLLIIFILLCTCTAILCTIMLNDITTDSLGETEGIPTTKEEDIKDMPLSGGWSLHFTEKEYELNGEKEKNIFEMISKKDVVFNYNPIACLGIKNAKNNNEYYYLCKRQTVVPETAVSSLYLLTVSERIMSEDNIIYQVTKEEPISLLTLIEKSGKTLATPSENALYLPGNSYIEETEDGKVVDLFNELIKDKTGKYTYCSLLGTQVVAGTNYLILSHYISEENVRSYKLLTIYNGVNGTKEIIREEEVDAKYLVNYRPLN